MIDLRTVRTIYAKELRETLRDRRTLIAMIAIPLLLYPLLILIVTQAAVLQAERLEAARPKVAVDARSDATIHAWLGDLTDIRVVRPVHAQAALRSGEIDAVVSSNEDVDALLANGSSATLRIHYDSAEATSVEALHRLRNALEQRRRDLLSRRLEDAGLTDAFVQPLNVEPTDTAPPRKRAGSLLGRILPVCLILMLGVGAFYPAIDVTAGEKERGTYETLLSTPASKTDIVTGKFLTILTLAMITSLLNLGSMALSLWFSLTQAADAGPETGHAIGLSLMMLSPWSVGVVLLVLVPLAFFVCAVMMSTALLARNFREAQNLVTPFFIVILLPTFYAAMPRTGLSPATALIPIANVALLFKDLLIGKSTLELSFTVFLCTAVYALLALVIAVRLFQNELVILARDPGPLLTLRRLAQAPRTAPTAGAALLLFGFMLLVSFYLGAWLQSRNLLIGLITTQWCLYLAPTLFVLWYARIDLRRTLRLRVPTRAAVLAAALIAVGALVLVVQAGLWQARFLPVPAVLKEQITKLLTAENGLDLTLCLLAVAVSPAVCEEVLFRGAIMAGLRTRLSKTLTILVVGLLFGLFHVSLHRVLPTGLFGVAIAYVVLRGGSLYLGIGLHLFVNAMSVLHHNQCLPDFIVAFLTRHGVEENGFPVWLLAAAAATVACGVLVMERRGAPQDSGRATAP